jgi:N-acetylglucosaminyl-diphospho-decaprenol L-rhamnosyltransferase
MTDTGTNPDHVLDVSVVIVTWNSASEIEGCLSSLSEELPASGSEVIVVDNGSRDRTLEVVRATSRGIHVIANSSNRGLAAANNQGMVASRGRVILICNPDVVFHPGSVRAMVEVLERHAGAAWVGPRFVDEDGQLQSSVGNLPTLAEAVLGRQITRRRGSGDASGFWWVGWAHDTERQVGRGLECAYVVRRRAIEEVGMQDERFVLDWEGFDWADRFHRAGWEIWFTPQAEVLHLGGTSRRQVPLRAVVSHHRGMYYYFSDRRRAVWKPFLAAAFILRALTKLTLTGLGIPLYSWAHREGKA